MKIAKMSATCVACLISATSLFGATPNNNGQQGNATTQAKNNVALNTDANSTANPSANVTATGDKSQDLQTRLRLLLQSDDSISSSARGIQITAQDGVVTLSGSVANLNEKNKLEAMVKQVNGVKKVTNNLEIATRP